MITTIVALPSAGADMALALLTGAWRNEVCAQLMRKQLSVKHVSPSSRDARRRRPRAEGNRGSRNMHRESGPHETLPTFASLNVATE